MSDTPPALTIIITMPDDLYNAFDQTDKLVSPTLTVNANTMEMTYEDEEQEATTRPLTEIDIKAISACLIWGGINKSAAHGEIPEAPRENPPVRIF